MTSLRFGEQARKHFVGVGDSFDMLDIIDACAQQAELAVDDMGRNLASGLGAKGC